MTPDWRLRRLIPVNILGIGKGLAVRVPGLRTEGRKRSKP
jgi:hypothetical protein